MAQTRGQGKDTPNRVVGSYKGLTIIYSEAKFIV